MVVHPLLYHLSLFISDDSLSPVRTTLSPSTIENNQVSSAAMMAVATTAPSYAILWHKDIYDLCLRFMINPQEASQALYACSGLALIARKLLSGNHGIGKT